MQASIELIRADWMYELRSACQRFYGLTYFAERAAVKEAFAWLREAIAPPQSVQEVQALEDLLLVCCTRAGTRFHVTYHRTAAAACPGSPVEAALHAWGGAGSDPRQRFDAWTEAFWSFVDATHPQPAVERAAALLARSFHEPPALDDVARQTGVSRRALTRGFRARYGMASREYVARLRLRAFIDLVALGTTAEEASRVVGYRRYHNLVDAVRGRGLPAPSAFRTLPYDRVRSLVDDVLPLTLVDGSGQGRKSVSQRRPASRGN